MRESKAQATDRLRREGLWIEASRFKDETFKQLRADGKTRSEAGEIAWEGMVREFPPQIPESDNVKLDPFDRP